MYETKKQKNPLKNIIAHITRLLNYFLFFKWWYTSCLVYDFVSDCVIVVLFFA